MQRSPFSPRPVSNHQNMNKEKDHTSMPPATSEAAQLDGRPRRKHVGESMPVVERRPVLEPAEDINESADAFIKRFRQHLQLQRLESIENYKQMLARGL
ncbi:hypothetical protein J5N97_004050 [Dioscorea zingiberensis]|uniref:Uncharacterized protein n=1 Tax=Dioscorea zingiberensis TaxID=325984 RepID=A0A9D5D6K9_9LILI|nr:hypothetical protein J5N97_004050 [Dioscorea zingiberensis]